MEREPADAAVEVEHRCRVDVVDPPGRLAVELTRDQRIRLHERPRHDVQRDVADGQRQGRLVGEQHLLVPGRHRLVLRQEADRHDADAGHELAQEWQIPAQPTHLSRRAEHEPHEESAVARLDDMHVLELSASGRHVVRAQPGLRDELPQPRHRHGRRGAKQPARTEIDAPTGGVENAESRRVRRAGGDHRRLRAEAGLP